LLVISDFFFRFFFSLSYNIRGTGVTAVIARRTYTEICRSVYDIIIYGVEKKKEKKITKTARTIIDGHTVII
jgi:hypothetical protein